MGFHKCFGLPRSLHHGNELSVYFPVDFQFESPEINSRPGFSVTRFFINHELSF
jgi:hypothetical protein